MIGASIQFEFYRTIKAHHDLIIFAYITYVYFGRGESFARIFTVIDSCLQERHWIKIHFVFDFLFDLDANFVGGCQRIRLVVVSNNHFEYQIHRFSVLWNFNRDAAVSKIG